MSKPSWAMEKPPDGLVPLTALPKETWVGRFVYSPMTQSGGVPYWREADCPGPIRDSLEKHPEYYMYDVGIVTEVVPATAFYGKHGVGEVDHCHFKDPEDKSDWKGLHYGAYSLWTVPKEK